MSLNLTSASLSSSSSSSSNFTYSNSNSNFNSNNSEDLQLNATPKPTSSSPPNSFSTAVEGPFSPTESKLLNQNETPTLEASLKPTNEPQNSRHLLKSDETLEKNNVTSVNAVEAINNIKKNVLQNPAPDSTLTSTPTSTPIPNLIPNPSNNNVIKTEIKNENTSNPNISLQKNSAVPNPPRNTTSTASLPPSNQTDNVTNLQNKNPQPQILKQTPQPNNTQKSQSTPIKRENVNESSAISQPKNPQNGTLTSPSPAVDPKKKCFCYHKI